MRLGGIVLLLAGTVRAQTNERYFEQVEKAIKQGGIAAIESRLQVEGIAGVPAWARRICSAAANSDLTMATRAKEAFESAAAKIQRIGFRCAQRHENDPDAWSARIDGAYFYLRVHSTLGQKTVTEDWLNMVADLVTLQGMEPDSPAALERAVKLLRRGRKADGPDAGELEAKEEEICKRGLEKFPGNPVFASRVQGTELDAVTRLLEAGDAKSAKPRLVALLAGTRDDTLYNDAVTVALTWKKKLHLKPRYRARTVRFHSVFDIEVPRGSRWKVKGDEIEQRGLDDKLLRKFTADWFRLNTLYYVGDKKYDGSNVKGMALISERDILGAIVKVKRRSRIIKKRLNRKISGAQYFVIGGFDKDADFVRFYSYCWKGKERDWLTYRLWIIEWEDLPNLDPAARFVRDSLRERKYRKKKK